MQRTTVNLPRRAWSMVIYYLASLSTRMITWRWKACRPWTGLGQCVGRLVHFYLSTTTSSSTTSPPWMPYREFPLLPSPVLPRARQDIHFSRTKISLFPKISSFPKNCLFLKFREIFFSEPWFCHDETGDGSRLAEWQVGDYTLRVQPRHLSTVLYRRGNWIHAKGGRNYYRDGTKDAIF